MNTKNKSLLIGAGAVSAAIAGTLIYLKNRRTIPKTAKAITDFELDRYLGKWYEIARIDFIHERNLHETTAEYSLNEDGSVKVINGGYNIKKDKWEEATGKAVFVKDKNEGMLKVSFFGPFYSGYNVLAVDDEYKYALVGGETSDYLWILSREKTITHEIKEQYLDLADSYGYNIDKLIWVKQHGIK